MSETLRIPEELQTIFHNICGAYGLTITTREELINDLRKNGPEEVPEDTFNTTSTEELIRLFCTLF
jgi:hypothetical protein